MKQLFLTAVTSALLLVGCNSVSPDNSADNSTGTTPVTQSAEVSSYEEQMQTTDDPTEGSAEMSSPQAMQTLLGTIDPTATIRAGIDSFALVGVGDTLRPRDNVRIIVKSIISTDTLRVRLERDLDKTVSNLDREKTVVGLAWFEGLYVRKVGMARVYSCGFTGVEQRNWDGQIFEDSISYTITRDSTLGGFMVPGKSDLHAKVLLTPKGKHIGDVAQVKIDSLDPVTHIQYGSGTIFNAEKGKTFTYTIEIKHLNPTDQSLPYATPQYNQVTVRYSIPMKNKSVDFKTLNVTIYFNVDRDGDGVADRHERDIVMTTENGDTVSVAKGNAFIGKWGVVRHQKFM